VIDEVFEPPLERPKHVRVEAGPSRDGPAHLLVGRKLKPAALQ
jgi:hypothetical protein